MAMSDDLARLSARARMAERLAQDVEDARRRTQEAEYGVLDAVLARMDAEASGSKVPS